MRKADFDTQYRFWKSIALFKYLNNDIRLQLTFRVITDSSILQYTENKTELNIEILEKINITPKYDLLIGVQYGTLIYEGKQAISSSITKKGCKILQFAQQLAMDLSLHLWSAKRRPSNRPSDSHIQMWDMAVAVW